MVILSCWNREPEERPKFSEVVSALSGQLTQMSDYMDLSVATTLSAKDHTGNSPLQKPPDSTVSVIPNTHALECLVEEPNESSVHGTIKD